MNPSKLATQLSALLYEAGRTRADTMILRGEPAMSFAEYTDRQLEPLRSALRIFAGVPESGKAETAVADDSPVTIRCRLGDVRRVRAALES